MKILVIGASGTIGTALVKELGEDHHIITANKRSGDFQVDVTDTQSVTTLFKQVGKVDAIIALTGNVHFGPLDEMTTEQFNIGLQDKVLGQVRVALVGQHFLNDGGSITLTSGHVSDETVRHGSNAGTANAALNAFVIAAAIDIAPGLRINAVSPTIITESKPIYGKFFPGFDTVPVSRVALAYRRSVEGPQTGRVYRIHGLNSPLLAR